MMIWIYFFILLFSSPVWATDRYISPSGSGNCLTSGSPCSFDTARNASVPGDRIIVEDGTYSLTTGWKIECGTNASNGTAGSPITLIAQNERQAHLAGNGSDDTVTIRNCSYWTIQGLDIGSADYGTYPGNGLGTPLSVCPNYHVPEICSHLNLRRNIFHHSNRFCNCQLVFLANSNNTLVEENEFYYNVRHAINVNNAQTPNSTGNVLRRNYFNPRNYIASCPPGCVPHNLYAEASTLYPTNNVIEENDIAENTSCYEILGAPGSGASNNKVLGSVCLNAGYGIVTYSYGDNEAATSANDLYENVVSINNSSPYTAFWARNSRNLTLRNVTAFGGTPGILTDLGGPGGTCCAPFSITLENVLVTGASSGLNIDSNFSRTLTNVNVSNSGSNTPSSGFTTTNPNLGNCRVFIPDGSPMKGKGTNGADIGANVLYRYQNGVLTNQPLWDPSTGQFPHGATVAGLNDVAGQSAFDVNQRLNVNANGCLLPTGYGGGSTGLNPPTSLVVNP
jgi:hypothetical protein